MKRNTENGILKTIFLVMVMLLISSTMAIAQVKVRGSIYGGGEKANVVGSDTVRIHGVHNDTILGDVYGGGMEGQVTVNAIVEMSSGVVGTPGKPNGTTNNGIPVCLVAKGGRVFGGGKGTTTNKQDGLVQGNTSVTISGSAKVLMNVYGGGEMASVGSGDLNDKSSGVATVTISGGEVGPLDGSAHNGYVFGGGKGLDDKDSDAYWNFANVDSSSVVMTAGTVWGSLFGGSEDGHVIGDATVTYSGGTLGTNGKTSWDGNIFGGGRNYEAGSNTSGRVGGNVHVTVTGEAAVKGNVYGGGRLASVGIKRTSAEDPTILMQSGADHGNIYVDILNGTIGLASLDTITSGTIFGGCMGDTIHTPGSLTQSVLAHAKNTYVRIFGGHVLANVYGGSAYGTVDENTHVDVVGGEIGVYAVDGETGNITRKDGNVFGSGRGYAPNTTTHPGGLAACANYGVVLNNTYVFVRDSIKDNATISSPSIHGIVFGGGEVASVGTYSTGPSATLTAGGTTHVTVTGGTIGPLDGTGINAYVFGGSQGVSYDLDEKYKYHATVGSTEIEIGEKAMVYGSVLGGGAEGHVWNNTNILIKGGTIGIDGVSLGAGHVYGGGGNMSESNTSSGRVGGNTHINMTAGTVKGGIFGGGYAGLVGADGNGHVYTTDLTNHGNTLVEVSNGTVGVDAGEGNVFGGGKGLETNSLFGNTINTDVRISGTAAIKGNVYGGGELASVGNSTKVAVSGGTVGRRLTFRERYVTDRSIHDEVNNGDVYGGGKGFDTSVENYELWGRVYGNTTVTVNGNANVRHNVYGGGRMASVGNFTFTTDGTINEWLGGGTATVSVGGNALIGPKKADLTEDITEAERADAADVLGVSELSETEYINMAFKYLGGNEGSVYGSGRGAANPSFNKAAYVKETSVSIEGNAQVVSCVFGGGENGRVYEDTEVTIGSETEPNNLVIGGMQLHGTSYTEQDENNEYNGITVSLSEEDSEIAEDDLGVGRRILRGQVFGGGRGTDTYPHPNPHVPVALYNPIGGCVYGNTLLTVNGGKIYNKVYGGGTISSVGTFTYSTSVPDSIVGYAEGTGKAEVVINGGQIGTDGKNNGDVFGGGLGSAVPARTQLTYLSYVGESHVTVESGAVIKSNVYGGAANGHVQGDAHVTVNGGTIGIEGHGGWHSNVFGGGGGTNRYNVTGRPNHLSISSGRVFGDTYVTVNGGQVCHNVYGGGAIASIGTYNLSGSGDPYAGYETGHGKATVNIKGGTIGYDGNENGMVFGSGRGKIDSIGAFLDSLSFAAYTEVNIGELGKTGPTIKGSVYGSGENGHVYMQAVVNINSGTIGIAANDYDPDSPDPYFAYRGNVYGGGCGTDKFDTDGDGVGDTYNPMSGIVYGDAEVNIKGGYISRNVYGAGAMASVGYYLAIEPAERHLGDTLSWPVELDFSMGGKTEVNITGGHIGTAALADVPLATGCVYGATRGDVGDRYKMAKLANVNEAYVTVNFDTPENNTFDDNTANVVIGSVFGGGESGHVYDTTSVTVNGGLIVGSVFGAGDGSTTYKDLLLDPATDLPCADSTMVCDIIAGKVFGNTSVTVNNGWILHNVYGGGNMASIGKSNYIIYGEDGDIDSTMTTGRAHVRIYGGTIGTIGTDGIENGFVYGSSRGMAHASVNKDKRYLYNRDYFLGYVNQSFVTIGKNVVASPNANSPRIYGSVFGGGHDGHVRLNTDVVINDAEIGMQYSGDGSDIASDTWKYRGNVYGAGRGLDMYDSDGDGVLDSYCSSAGSVTRNTHVTVNGGLIHRDVYGGGSLGTVGPPPKQIYLDYDPSLTTVDIIGGTIGDAAGIAKGYGGNVYGSSRGEAMPILNNFATVKEAVVNIGAKSGGGTALVNGSVYGSGENGHVNTNATVNIYSGKVGNVGNAAAQNNVYCGNVYGAGSGTDMYDSNNDNTPDAYNPNAGIVKGKTFVNVEGGEVLRSVYGGGEMASVNDSTHVTVSGGTVGVAAILGDKDNPSLGGNVFGAGKGVASNSFTTICNVPNTLLTVKGGDILGEVYGGAENGHVTGNTNVLIKSGANIGVDATSTNDGNVFGGGMGSGAPDASNANEYRIFAHCGRVGGNTNVTMDGGDIMGSIFGGGRLALVGVDADGEVTSFLTDGNYDHTNHGLATITVTGGYIGNDNPDELLNGSDESVGDIFGSGKGDVKNYEAVLAGRVANTSINISEAPRIYGSVFGGGEMAGIGYWDDDAKFYDNSGAAEVTIGGTPTIGTEKEFHYGYAHDDPSYWTVYGSDGKLIHTCTGNVYGGSQGDVDTISPHWVSMARSRTATVLIEGNPTIMSRVFGGAEQGSVAGNTSVTVTGGTIGSMANTDDEDDTNDYLFGGVYGGGFGSQNPIFNGTHMQSGPPIVNDSTEASHLVSGDLWTANYLAGRTYGDVRVDLLGGIINGDVYGGSEFAYIGGYGDNPGGKAKLYIGNKDQVGHDEEGVTILGDVYGANNFGGSPMDSVQVHIYHTKHTTDNLVSGTGYALANVFGGGNQSNYTPNQGNRTAYPRSALVHVYNCENTIEDLYGGSNASDIGTELANADANIIVEGGRLHRVFGGGKGDNASDVSANIYGTAHTQILGGIIEAVFGGGNQQGSILYTDLIVNDDTDCDMKIDSIFGGSNEAPTIGNITTTIACSDGKYDNLYGGANNADITGNVTLNVLGSEITNVFGGSKGSEDHAANIDGNVTLNIFGGNITNAFGGSDINGNITGVVTVNVIDTLTGCALDLTNVYGGSRLTALRASNSATVSPVVNLVNGTVKGDVFGGSYGVAATTSSNPEVNIGYASYMDGYLPKYKNGNPVVPANAQAAVMKHVHGGGELASVKGNTTVNINRGTIGTIGYRRKKETLESQPLDSIYHVTGGSVFGGGEGDSTYAAYALVDGNTNVNIKGGHVYYSVYGGGELASVTGKATVNVTGGQVGPAPRIELPDYNVEIGLNGVDGYVFGGGQGIGSDTIKPSYPYGKYYQHANVGSAEVIVNIPANADTTTNRLWGSVFGGAEDGHVIGDAKVTYISGLMGTKGTTSYDGNIFGGGRNYSKMNYTAGRVGGNIKVEMRGGQIYGSIFGGGRLALTGVNEKGEQAPGAGHGNVKVIVKGGKVGNEKLITDFTKFSMGDVYGGGKGDMKGLNGHPAASALLISLTRNTEVIVKDSIDADTLVSRPIIYGTVFGGGEVANVGYFDWDTIINPNTGKPDIANIEFKNTTDGHAKVVVSGGRIGADRMKMRYDLATDGSYNLRYNDDVGHVYGGGEGKVDNPDHYATINPVYPSTATPGIHNNKSLLDLMAVVQSTEVIVSDSAWVKGSVYGGAANGHIIGDTWVKIQGGLIGAGDNGTTDVRYTEEQFLASDTLDGWAECAHWDFGDEDGNYNPYDPVDVADHKYPSDGKSWFGNVFGGGSGYYPYIVSTNTGDSTVWNPESGIVYGNSKVEITGGHILTNVYGGGEVNDVLGDSTIVTMSGGTLGVPRKLEQIGRHPVTCYLFGAGKGDPRTRFNTWTNVEGVRVEVSGGWIYGSIFGGGEEGHVHNDVKLIVRGNTGTNEQAIAGTATKIGTLGYSYVDGNVFGGGRGFSGEALTAGTVGGNINVNIRGGQMLGSIYGGGRLASVGTNFANPESPLYGHFKEDEDGHTYGYITVNISGGVIGNDHESTLEHTRGGNVFGGSMGRLTKLDGEYSPIWPFLARAKKTVVNITGGKIKSNVYGGSELGTVRDSAVVIVNGGIVMRDVFAGGYGSDKTDFIHSEIPNHDVIETTPMQTAGRVYGNTRIALNGGWVQKNVYGGGELASVGTINSYTEHPEPEESTTNSTFNLSWPYEFVYAENTGTATIKVTGGRIGITGKDVMGNVEKEDNGDIYGGGKGIAGDRYVMAHCANVNNSVIHVNYTDNTATPNNYTDTLTANRKGCIAGALYGGGENGHVNTDVHVTIDKGLVGHAVYGGGKGKDTYVTTLYHYDPETYAPTTQYDTSIYSITAGKVYGNTYVTINGGYVVRNVFGGGNLASVGKGNYAGGVGDYSTTGYGECVTNEEDWNYVHNSGHAYVTIKGGEIGMLNPSDPEKVFKENVPYGSVFGGCRGVAVPEVPRALTPRYKYCPEDFLGYVNYTHVTIGTDLGTSSDLHLYGSVYGGAQDGHVRWNTTTNVKSGEIGVNYNSANAASMVGTADIYSKHWTERGNVYGAGSGIGQWTDGSNKSHYSSISGSVTQFDTVNIKGGIIHRNVYGGGNLATVGPPRIKQTNDCPNTLTGVVVNVHSATGENTSSGYGGYVYGGSRGMATADSTNAYNFEKFAYCPYTTVNLYNGAHVYNSVFGGGENGQIGVDHKNAELIHTSCVNVYDGAVVDGSVYGGGQGSWGLAHHLNDTISGRVRGSTLVNLNNSQVVGNIYGGGALGIVMDSAVVVIAGGQVHDVFGAGSGYQTLARRGNADVTTATRVNIDGGTVHGSVFGGGEYGSVGFLAAEDATVTTNVNLNAGHLEHSAYGGGKNGYSRGGTFMNVSGTCVVDENVFGGAYGRTDTVFVAGLRTVNMRGGTVKGSVYGGSYNADDALVFTPRPFATNDTVVPACVVNYSGGQTDLNVFGAGYFGRTYGSTYIFIGERAIANAPNHSTMAAPYDETYFSKHNDLMIGRDIWSGADFGIFEPGSSSTFGTHTITGRSDIYIDGNGYDTEHSVSQGGNTFMRIGTDTYKGNVFGCGTLNDGGRAGKIIMVRDYGKDLASGSSDAEPWANATRELYSIQHADSLIIESSHVHLAGRGIVSISTTTEPYTIHNILNTVRVVNGSSLYIDKPIENIGNLYSVVCNNDLYDNPTYVPVRYQDLIPNASTQATNYDNKFRINQGTHVSVNMAHESSKGLSFTYGALIGFFHMMTDGEFNAYAYARPKNSTVSGNGVYSADDNPGDGGFVSYRGVGYNTFSSTGDSLVGPFVQMPYENHTPAQQARNGEAYYRVWRYFKSALSTYDVQLIAISTPGEGYTSYKPLRPVLLPPGKTGDYYKVKKTMGVASINYGSEIKTVNAGVKSSTATWMYSDGSEFIYTSPDDAALDNGKDFMKIHPNNAFGLTMIPEGGFSPVSGTITGDTVLICSEANNALINSQWDILQLAQPQFDFRLTHYNKITGNFQWDPISIVLEQYNSNDEVIGEVEIRVTITTKTTIEQDNDIDTYALMVHTQPTSGEGGGDHYDVYSAKVLLPTYDPYAGTESIWTLTDVQWEPYTKANEGFSRNTLVADEPYDYCYPYVDSLSKNFVGMTMYPTINYDNSNGWLEMTKDTIDLGYLKGSTFNPITLGKVDPRQPFSIQFDLHYDSKQNVGLEGNDTMGRVIATAHFTNYLEPNGRDVKFNVYVLRRGKGRGFYIDGEHGEFTYSGHYPDASQPSLAGIFYFTDFEPCDTIYIVNKVTANAVDNLSWDGREYGQVNIYRYNGGHPLRIYTPEDTSPYYADYLTTYQHNPAYKGELVDVLTSMSITSIVLDGAYLKPEQWYSSDDPATMEAIADHVVSQAPMIRVANGAELTVKGGEDSFTNLRNNYNKGSNGGAIDINLGGTVKMNQNSFVEGNYVKDGASEEHHGGAIYMDEYATLLLSDSVMINSSQHVRSNNKLERENVYIANYNTAISVGTMATDDPYGTLNAGSRIGVTKNDWNGQKYTPVVYTEYIPHGEDFVSYGSYLRDQQVIYDDGAIYGLLEYPLRHPNNDPDYLNKLYFAKTWVNQIRDKDIAHWPGNKNPIIDKPEQLAWVISKINCYNGQKPNTINGTITITKDLDMSEYLWVPIGYQDDKHDYRFKGTFEGDGHAITGLQSSLSVTDKGMFGSTYNATIRNLQAEVELFTYGKVGHLGGLIGSMDGGELSNCESAGYLQSGSNTEDIGGLVGKKTGGTIHSCFATDTLHTVYDATVLGGLVGDNSSNLFNSYSNFVVDKGSSEIIGGLVGINRAGSRVENCYSVVADSINAIVYDNQADLGYIKYCYGNHSNYQTSGTAPRGHGIYNDVKGRNEYGYMYQDNLVTLEDGEANTYWTSDITYPDGTHTIEWPGLLSTLNKWVKSNPVGQKNLAPWFRPTTDKVNGDLPILGFHMDSTLAVVDNNAFMHYSSDFNALLDSTNKLDAQSTLFLYGTASQVEHVPDAEVKVFVNEDAVLMQTGDKDFVNTTTGITFDNSYKQALDAFADTLKYDWHLLSSPLSNAPMGISYTDEVQNWWYDDDDGQVTDVEHSYMPDHINELSDDIVKWDYYTYYEPEYHWINFKRNSFSHHHYDYPHAFIDYTNEDSLVPAKGYMMAISKDSYLSNTGTLNRGTVKIPVTALAPDDIDGQPSYNKGSNLVGNPYQAYLDLDKVAAGNVRSKDALKDFFVYIAEAGVYSPYTAKASKNPLIPSQYIHPHQGFFVLFQPAEGSETTMDMVITPSMAGTTKDEGSYFRGQVEEKVNYPLVNLIVQNENGERDLAIVELGRPELGGVEKVENLQNSNFKLYTRMEERNYSLLFTPVGTQRVPLFFKTPDDGKYTLHWDTHNGTCKKMLLIDNIAGTEYDMLANDSYSFNGYAADYAARFYIVFELDNPIDVDAEDDDFAFFDGTQWVINGEGQLELFDVTGRVLYSNTLNGAHNHVSFDHVAAGTYMLRLAKDSKHVKSQKIIIY